MEKTKQTFSPTQWKDLWNISKEIFFTKREITLTRPFWYVKITWDPWLVWLSGLSTGLRTKGLQVWFLVRAHVWVTGQVSSGGMWEAPTHWCFSPSLSPSLPLSENKILKKKILCFWKSLAMEVFLFNTTLFMLILGICGSSVLFGHHKHWNQWLLPMAPRRHTGPNSCVPLGTTVCQPINTWPCSVCICV